MRLSGSRAGADEGGFPDHHSRAEADPQQQLAAEGAARFRPTLAVVVCASDDAFRAQEQPLVGSHISRHTRRSAPGVIIDAKYLPLRFRGLYGLPKSVGLQEQPKS